MIYSLRKTNEIMGIMNEGKQLLLTFELLATVTFLMALFNFTVTVVSYEFLSFLRFWQVCVSSFFCQKRKETIYSDAITDTEYV